MKKWISIILALGMLVVMFAGCGSTDAQVDGETDAQVNGERDASGESSASGEEGASEAGASGGYKW